MSIKFNHVYDDKYVDIKKKPIMHLRCHREQCIRRNNEHLLNQVAQTSSTGNLGHKEDFQQPNGSSGQQIDLQLSENKMLLELIISFSIKEVIYEKKKEIILPDDHAPIKISIHDNA